MHIVKLYGKLTACISILIISGCVNRLDEPVDFNRSEAVKARIHLALAYLEQKAFAKAKENIDKALHHDAQDYLPHSVLAYYYQQINETENATIAYQKALSLSQTQSPDQQPRPDVLNNYGTFLCEQGKFEQAYQQFEQALASKHPYYHQADSLENLILCANMAKNLPKQLATLTQLTQIDEKRATKLRHLVQPK